ncbi:hypothetical protein AX15_000068 [Amanita polypyramis BW_CC]|nr:hypothetical protein AX15_000068 [Amanita polypyramis BW_CC]
MPIVAPGSKVLVTGANGHIATWVIRTLLEQGYTVRGTVRSQAKGAFLLDLFKSYGDKLELVVVEDLTKENAFDESVNGVDAIEHIAAPMTYQFDSMKDVVDPAVEGTLNILRAAKKTPRVKRIVILSSAAAIKLSGTEPLNENDWNEECLQKYEHDKSSLDPFFAYQVEKTLSEKSAWSFYREHEGRLHWDLTSIVSTFVFGPYLGPASTPGEMNGTSQMWYGAVVAPNSSGQPNEALLAVADGWVDVRDLASTLTRSLIVAEASNERIIVNSGKIHARLIEFMRCYVFKLQGRLLFRTGWM